MGENKQKKGQFSSDRSFKRYEQLKQKGCFGPGGWNNGQNLNRFFLSDSTSKNTPKKVGDIKFRHTPTHLEPKHAISKMGKMGSCEIVRRWYQIDFFGLYKNDQWKIWNKIGQKLYCVGVPGIFSYSDSVNSAPSQIL